MTTQLSLDDSINHSPGLKEVNPAEPTDIGDVLLWGRNRHQSGPHQVLLVKSSKEKMIDIVLQSNQSLWKRTMSKFAEVLVHPSLKQEFRNSEKFTTDFLGIVTFGEAPPKNSFTNAKKFGVLDNSITLFESEDINENEIYIVKVHNGFAFKVGETVINEKGIPECHIDIIKEIEKKNTISDACYIMLDQ